jgi:hypothetical protein
LCVKLAVLVISKRTTSPGTRAMLFGSKVRLACASMAMIRGLADVPGTIDAAAVALADGEPLADGEAVAAGARQHAGNGVASAPGS